MKIRFEKVGKKFGAFRALKGVSFLIKEGEFVFITGPSGAGKTTVLRLISGYYLPTEGKIYLDDQELATFKKRQLLAWRRQVGMVFQEFKLIPQMNVAENVMVAFQIRRLPHKLWPEEMKRALKIVGLNGREEMFPAQLSGGELQRLCLARALAMHPKIILADEPTGNLDPTSSWALMDLLLKINRQKKTTVIMATHNTDIVNSMAKRVIHLEKGQLISDRRRGKYHE